MKKDEFDEFFKLTARTTGLIAGGLFLFFMSIFMLAAVLLLGG